MQVTWKGGVLNDSLYPRELCSLSKYPEARSLDALKIRDVNSDSIAYGKPE